MIIDTEIKEEVNMFGDVHRVLYVSYIDKNGKKSYLKYEIPPEMMYQWRYAKHGEMYDKDFLSWDFKKVIRVPAKDQFTEQRTHEIIMDVIRMYPDANIINDVNIPHTAFTDIEVDVDDDGFPDADTARNQVNTISWVDGDAVVVFGLAPLTPGEIEWIKTEVSKHCERFDTKYKFEYRYYASEYEMLYDYMFNYVKCADCISGWNIFGYDWPYLYNRCNNIGLDIQCLSITGKWTTYKPQNASSPMIKRPCHICIYDYMEVYKKWDRSISPKEQNTLDWVAEKALGVKKVVHQLGFKDMWEQQKKEYVFYNAIDSVLVREIDKKLKTSTVLFSLASIMHTPTLTAFSSSKSIEIVQAEYLYKENRIFPNVGKTKSGDESYEGAFVFEPIPGVKRNVLTLDFASLYPTTMMQFNISPDTFKGKNKTHIRQPNEIMTTSGAVYSKDFKGFIPKILTDFYAQRKAYKKDMKIAEKEYYELMHIYERRCNNANPTT